MTIIRRNKGKDAAIDKKDKYWRKAKETRHTLICHFKKSFISQAHAMSFGSKHKQYPYKCNVCGKFHLTKKFKKLKWFKDQK